MHAIDRLRFRQTTTVVSHAFSNVGRCFSTGKTSTEVQEDQHIFGGGTPRSELKIWYDKKHRKLALNESSFQFEDRFHEGKVWWTARFICPDTNKVFQAGTLDSKKKLFKNWTWSKAESRETIEFDNKIYYQKMKTAMHAAAGRRLDSIAYEELGSKRRKYCLEKPAATEEMSDAGSIETASSPVAKTETEQVESVASVETPELARQEVSKVSYLYNVATGQSPKCALHNHYASSDIRVGDNDYELNLHEGGNCWSVNFTCPKTERVYTSGTLREDAGFIFAIGEIVYLKGQPYYDNTKAASQAAAARALDHIQFELHGTTEPRLCQEDPSSLDSVYENPDAQQLKPQGKKKEEDTVSTVKFFDEEMNGEQDSMDDLTLQSTTLLSSTTLDRVMEAWSDGVGMASSETASPSNDAALPLTWTPMQERKKILSEAKAWLDSLQSKTAKQTDTFVRFRHILHVSVLTSCNAILTVLAKANQIRNGSDIQAIADLVFNFLWSGSKPNTETYNMYMQCLSGEPGKVAQMAQEILLEMMSGKEVAGNQIPSPTVETFNTVIKLWAWAGDAGQCQEVFKLMNSREVKVNTETGINMLSSLAYSKFDYKAASAGIKFMKETDIFDKSAYYTPLRWSGKQVGGNVFPWDDIADLYSNGLASSMTEDSKTEAEAIDKWVSNIEESEDLDISIGCYEAVIQAWVRTGTREGLEKAEKWASRAFNSASNGTFQPRLQTYYPILAAWAFSGEEAVELTERIEKLREWSNTYPHLQQEGRINSIRLLATRRYLTSLLSKDRATNADMESARSAAAESLQELTLQCAQLVEYHSEKESRPSFLETSAFIDVLSCLGTYGQGVAQRKDEKEAKVAANSILATVTQFQLTLKGLHTVLRNNDDTTSDELSEEDDATDPVLRLQLNHFLNGATGVYKCALSHINEIENALAEPNSSVESLSLSATSLPEIESMLRSSEECRQLLTVQGGTNALTKVCFSDHFSFHDSNEKGDTPSQFDLCSKAVEVITKSTDGQCTSDQVRVLALIIDVALDDAQLGPEPIQLSNLCSDIVGFLQSTARPDEKEAILQYFLRTISGKAKSTIGVIDVKAIAKAAKIRLHKDFGTEPESSPHPRARSTSPKRGQKRTGKRRQRRNSAK